MTGKASAAILVLLTGFLLLSVGCDGETAQENTTPSGTEDAPLSKEAAIEAVLDIVTGNPENKVDPSTAKADLMTEREAYEAMTERGGLGGRPAEGSSDDLVWLVEVRGEFLVVFRGYGRLTPEPEPRAGTSIWIVTMEGSVQSSTFVYDTDAGH